MYKVKVNDKFNYDVEIKEEMFFVNGEDHELDAVNNHIVYQNKSFNTEIVEHNKAEKTCKIKVNGSLYSVKIEDQYDLLLKQLGLDNFAATKVSEIKAPMPGLVLKVFVTEGMEVKKGDNLLILEAMKMENILKSSAEGIVKKVLVKQGDKVEKNQILIQFA